MRLSVRLRDLSQERFMLRIDLSQFSNVDEFIKHVTELIDPPIFDYAALHQTSIQQQQQQQ